MPSAELIASSLASGFLLGGILALTALGLSLVLGVMRLVNLAHGEFLIAGAYAGLFLLKYTGIDPIVGLAVIAGTVALFALPVHQLLLMPLAGKGPEAPMMTTFGLSIILQNVFVLAFSADTRAIERDYAEVALTLGPITVAQIYVIGFAISALVIGAVHILIAHTAFGRDLRASAADADAAATVGVNVRRVHALTFALGAACAALGGTLIGIAFSFTPVSGATYLLTDFAIVVLGGLGNILGTLIGGITLGVLQSIGGVVLGDGYRDLVGLALFLVVLAFRPQGLLASSSFVMATQISSVHGSRSVATNMGLVVTGLLLLGLCVMIFVPRWVGEYGTQIGFRALIYLTLAEAWNLLAGYGGLVSLGSSSFVGIGAYILMGMLNAGGFSIATALMASGLGASALAVIVSPAVFRLRGLYFTVGTLALGEALRLFMINVSYFGGASGIFLNSNPPPIEVLYVYAVALAGIATLVMEVYTGTRFSILLRSVRDDEDAASQVGVRAFRVKLVAFAVASLLMGAAGGLQALKLGAIEPYGMFGLQWSIDTLSIVIIGGLGMRFGPIVGTVFVIALAEALADYPELHLAMTGVILILIIRFAPKGLCGLGWDLWGMLSGRWSRARVPRLDGAQT